MVKNLGKRLLPLMLAIMLIMSAMPLNVFATTIETVLEGQISITDTANTVKDSNGTVTATAKGSLFSKTTNTITITNESNGKAQLSFNYSVASSSSFTIDDATANTSGTVSKVLDAGASVVLKITSNSGLSGTTVTLTMSNFSLVAASDSSNVTFDYDTNYGSVTVGGTVIADGDVKNIPLTGAALVATPVSGATFLGWVNAADSAIISTAASYTITPASDMTVKAVFVGANSAPHFMLGAATQNSASTGLLNLSKKYYYTISATHIYDTLTAAAEASKTLSSKYIVLANNGTLPAGDYTIPSGATLLIPFDSANTLFTTEALSSPDYVTPTAYRTLKLAAGANINIEGAMSLSAKHRYATGKAPNIGGTPVGPVPFVDMAEGSNITVKNGGKLYAYGYITGSGSVTAKSGASVYEYFQIMDFRGGTQSTDNSMEDNGVFPLSQYYVQNIEVPLTLDYGSTEYAYTSIYMSEAEFSSSVAFISSSNAMFNLTSGAVTKRYDGSTDRLRIEANGNMTVSGISMQVGTSKLDSSDYELPVNSNITVTVDGGTITMNQDIALLPGSEILIGEDAECVLGSGYNVYVYDADQWVGCIYNATSAGNKNAKVVPVVYAPGRTYNRTEADLFDAKVQVEGIMDASNGHLYTTTSGANIFSTGNGVAKLTAGTETVTHQLQQVGSTFVDIPIVPAKLKNADGTYLDSTTGEYVYNSEHGKWVLDAHTFTDSIFEPTCTENGYTRHTCTCGYYYDDSIVEANGHDWIEKVEDYIEPNCVNEGKRCFECKTCSDTKEEPIPKDANKHNIHEEINEPTCTQDGYYKSSCLDCNSVLEEKTLSKEGHEAKSSVVTAPTCTEQGYTTHICGKCDESYIDSYVDAIGHDYDAVVTEPTCTDKGYTTHTCANCSDSYVDSYVDALGHSMGDWIIDTDATCEENGEKHKECSACDYTESEEIPSLGHDYDAVVTEPTCTAQGYTTHTCTACGDTKVDTYVDALGHSYGDWEEVTAPTHTKEGLKQHTCSACGDVETEAIQKIICDADGDGDADAYELSMMRKFLVETLVPTTEEKALFDMNDDGAITVKDLVILKKYIADIPF